MERENPSLELPAVQSKARPLMSLRLKSVETETPERWRDCFSALAAHPGCCDEIWFSTGTQMANIEWHRSNASVIAEAAKEVERLGITPSLQFQATIGHDDALAIPELSTAKTWTGWTGWNGREDRYCSCPRHPAFHDYLRKVAATYAKIGFSAIWIDDDLRLSGHKPADNGSGRVGCWCDMCIDAFGAETGVHWTRDALAKAILNDEALSARWRSFSIDSLCLVARCVAETFRSLSPGTMMGLQHVNFLSQIDQVRALLETLHKTGGGEVGFRPGGGEYYDSNPEGLVVKSIRTGEARVRLGDPEWVKVWTPEIESWPRTYYSRSPQGVLVEAFSALMFGMNSISFFVSDASKESNELYGRTLWKALAGAAPALRGYAGAIEGCTAIGYRTAPVEWDASVGIRRAAIPVLAGPGRTVGELTEGERGLNVNTMTSGDVQNLRDELDHRACGLPATVCSPFNGLMQMHVDAEGHIRTVALMGMSLSSQENVQIRLRPQFLRAESAVWHAMGRNPERMKIERAGGAAYATIPEIAAWNGGWLEF